MKRLKFTIPVLAFVIAVTVAFAVPAEVKTDKVEVFDTHHQGAWYEDPHTWECLECEYVQDDCDVNNTGEICTCYVVDENGNLWPVDARNDPNDLDSSLRCAFLYRPWH